jgi:CBS domain-containing protein
MKVRKAMKNTLAGEAVPRLTLGAGTAAELMTPNPVSISADATVREAVAFLTDKGFSAAPVIDKAGRPIGVLSRADILVHDREKPDRRQPIPEYFEQTDLTAPPGGFLTGLPAENAARVRVRDLMTPAVFSVAPETPAHRVVTDMVGLNVHRLFVVGRDGVLVGVISALDVLRHLGHEAALTPSI